MTSDKILPFKKREVKKAESGDAVSKVGQPGNVVPIPKNNLRSKALRPENLPIPNRAKNTDTTQPSQWMQSHPLFPKYLELIDQTTVVGDGENVRANPLVLGELWDVIGQLQDADKDRQVSPLYRERADEIQKYKVQARMSSTQDMFSGAVRIIQAIHDAVQKNELQNFTYGQGLDPTSMAGVRFKEAESLYGQIYSVVGSEIEKRSESGMIPDAVTVAEEALQRVSELHPVIRTTFEEKVLSRILILRAHRAIEKGDSWPAVLAQLDAVEMYFVRSQDTRTTIPRDIERA